MKKILVTVMSLVLVVNVYSLSRRMVMDESSYAYQKNDKVKIKKEELPEASRKTLEGDAFKGWTMVNSYKLKNGEYEVELKKDGNAQTITFDKDGKVK